MKFKSVQIILFLLLSICLVVRPVSAESAKPFAVVELYTSEGCSSCPPADQLLSQIKQIADNQNKRIFTLGFHVDYWNYLGWDDKFSDKNYTDRQRAYAQRFRSRTIYTPQMIVNGTTEFSGYRSDEAQTAIDQALSQQAQCGIILEVSSDKQDKAVNLKYKVSNAPEKSVINIAVVESNISTNVLRGENAGRTLAHDSVVRAFSTMFLTNDSGESKIHLPNSFKPEHTSLIVYIQDPISLKIYGAEHISLNI